MPRDQMHRNFLDSRNIFDWMVAYCQDQSSPLYMDETGSTHKSSVHLQLYRCRHRRHNRRRLFHYHSRGHISVFRLLIIQIPKCMVLHPTRLLSFRTSQHLQPFFRHHHPRTCCLQRMLRLCNTKNNQRSRSSGSTYPPFVGLSQDRIPSHKLLGRMDPHLRSWDPTKWVLQK